MKHSILVIILLFFGSAFAQNYSCTTDARFWEMMKTDSAYKSQNALLEKAIQQGYAQSAMGMTDTVINIPVVVHIIHKGEAIGTGSNLTDAQIYSALEGVNDRFRGRWGFGEDSKIQFCLAKSDPDGKYTTGINRVLGSTIKNFDSLGMSIYNGGPAAFEHDVKDLSRWPTTLYYNIWVVWNIYGPTGFAYLPTKYVDNYDGAVITAGGFNYNNSITTHELGHAFNLLHVWETNYTTCQSTANCDKVDDRICDTPPHINMGSGECTDVYPCSTSYDWDNTRYNYLGKCGSQNRFTPDQVDRMRASIAATVRDSLTHAKSCFPQHKNDLGITNMLTCGSDLKVIVKNYGANSVAQFSVGWSIDGKSQKVYNWKGTLTSEAMDTVVISSNILSASAEVDLKIWPIKPNNVADTIYQNDTFIQLNTFLPLTAGNYTIGGTSPDYKTIGDATEDLNKRGICGSVVFNIRKGTYKEQSAIKFVNGSSSSNTITFQSEGKDASLVEIVFDKAGSTNNYVMLLDGAKHVNIKHLTLTSDGTVNYSNVIQQINNATSNHIEFCILNGKGATWSTSTNNALIYAKNTFDSSNVISNNVFNGGSYGIYQTGSIQLGQGVNIDSNRFNNQTYIAVYLNYQNHPKISNNVITSSYNQTFSISMENSQKEIQVLNNRIYGKMEGGIRINNCKGSISHRGIIANNFIQLDGTRINEGISIRDSDHQLIAHNSVYLKASDTSSKSLNCYRSYAIDITNNILSNHGDGYAIYLDRLDTDGLTVNYCDLYSTGKIGYFEVDLSTFQKWKSQTGFDANSISVDPNFQTDSFLFPCQPKLNGAGKYLYQVETDILAKKRNTSNPDIGALEFNLDALDLGRDTTVCGTFTIDALIPNAKYTWNTGDTTQRITVDTSGQYIVEVANVCGNWRDTIEVHILNKPKLNFTSIQPACDSVQLTAKTNGNLLWETGDTSKSIYAFKSGYYAVTSTNMCGQISDSIQVIILDKPQLKFGSVMPACDSVSLTATTNGALFWQSGDTSKSIQVLKSGYYSASSTNVCGKISDSIYVTIWPKPMISLGADTSACDFYHLTPPINNYHWLWNTSDTTKTLIVAHTGAYAAELRNSFGCSAMSDTIQIEIYPSPTVFIGNDTTILESGSLVIKTKKGYSQYQWSTGSTTSNILLKGEDLDSVQTISVTVIDENGCEGSDTIVVYREKLNSVMGLLYSNEINIYPNPTNDVLTIASKAESKLHSFVIYDFAGQIIMRSTINKSIEQIDVRGLTQGAYIIEVSDVNQRTFRLNFMIY